MADLKKVLILLVLVVILLVITTKLTTNNNTTDQKIKDSLDQVSLTVKNKETALQNTPATVSDKKLISQLDIYSLTFDTMVKQANACGFNFNGETNTEASLIREGDINNLSVKQQNALQIIIDGCKDWFSALENLNQDEIDSLKKKANDSMTDVSLTTFSPETLKNAQSLLKNSTDQYDDSLMLNLLYLLKYDLELAIHIGSKIGTENIAMIQSSNYEIVEFYLCKKSPRTCSSSSIKMSMFCLVNEDHCGINFYQYIGMKRTINEVIDLQNMADILFNLIASESYPF